MHLLGRPQVQVRGLGLDGRLGEVLQDLWQLRRDVDLLGCVDGVRHGYKNACISLATVALVRLDIIVTTCLRRLLCTDLGEWS